MGGSLNRTVLRVNSEKAEGSILGETQRGNFQGLSWGQDCLGKDRASLAARRVKLLVDMEVQRLLGALWS